MTGLNLMEKTLAAVRGARLSSFNILDVVGTLCSYMHQTVILLVQYGILNVFVFFL
jgi:hypothetical protein